MATLLSIADGGNMMTASTWGVVEPTSFQGTPTVALSTTLASVNQFTATAFTLANAVTISGIALQLSGRVAAPTGTFNVQLYNVTSATIVGQVTINIIDLPNSNGVGANHIDWIYFKFASPTTTIAGNSYVIRFQTSVTSQVSIYYTTSTTNVNRALVTTTTQAPVTGDALIIAGNYTSAGVNANTTVIMNDNGNIITGTIWVSPKGIFKYLTSTIGQLNLAGHIVIGVGGYFNIGTISAPIIVSALLVMVCTTALQYSIWVYGTFTSYGLAKTISSKLASDVSSLATSCTTTTETQWNIGDYILIPSTSRTYTEYDYLVLNANSSGTSISMSSTSYNHGGNSTTKVQADIVNVFRNIQFLNNLNTARSSIQIFANAIVSFYYTKFQDFGTGTIITNSGICVNALTSGIGSFDFQGNVVTGSPGLTTGANCAMFTINDTATTISNNIFWSLGWTTTTPTLSIFGINDNNYIIGCLSSAQVLASTYMGSNNVFSSNLNYCQTGFYNNATNNSFYSNSSYGLYYAGGNAVNNTGMNNFKIWRNNTFGLFLGSSQGNKTTINTFDNIYAFGNTITNIAVAGGSRIVSKILFSNSYFYGGSTLVTPYSISLGNTITNIDALYFNNCYFGYSDSSLTSSPHTIAAIANPTMGQSVNFNNCYFNPTPIDINFSNTGISNTSVQAGFNSTKHNGVTGSNRVWHNNGTLSTDLTIYNTTSPSLRMTPVTTSYKLPTTNNKIPVKAGQTCTIAVKVRKSTATDGTQYGGGVPRLMYVFNPIAGNLTETIAYNMISTSNWVLAPGLLTNSVWVKSIFDTLTGGQSAPDGSSTAFLYNETGASANPSTVAQGAIPAYSTTVTYTVWTKTGTATTRDFLLRNNTTLTNFDGLSFNYSSTGNLGNGWTSTNVGGGWFKLVYTRSTGISIGDLLQIYIGRTGGAVSGSTATWYIWQPTVQSQPTDVAIYGQWETITYTTPAVTNDSVLEFYVDCDGAVGWINVDDWSTTTYNDTRGTNYWGNSSVYIEADYKVPGASYTFFN